MMIAANIISMTILFAVPLLLVAMGGMFSEHSGVINIALEGMMIIGALFACFTLQGLDQSGFGPAHPQLSMFIAILVAGVTGMIFSLLLGFAAINLKADQTIGGTALNQFAPAFAVVMTWAIQGQGLTTIFIPNWVRITRDTFGLAPVDGPSFWNNLIFKYFYLTTPVAIVLFIAAYIVMYKTRFGLRLRACGEHPCEARCRRNMIDDPINIRGLKRYAVDHAGVVPNPPCAPATGKTVAIVGGGPSGLSCAYYLALMGHKVTIFEECSKLGGMLRYGIPSYRFPREKLDAEIDSILSLGIEVRTNVRIGRDIWLEELEKQFDCIYIAIGAHQDKKTGIPGEDSRNVLSAVEMLKAIGDDVMPDFTGKQVVVIGGGNVAMDVTRSSIRLGAGKVTCVYRRRLEDMTALPDEVAGATAEGAEMMTLAAPVRIEADEDGVARALWVQPQIIGDVDSSGRPKPNKAALDQVRIPADIIVVAIGQGIEIQGFDQAGVPITRGGRLVAALSGQVNDMDNIFAGGDCVTGPATAIRAIAAGKVAAANIDEHLGFHHEIRVDVDIPAPRLNNRPPHGRINTTERQACERKCDFEDIECGLTEEGAVTEASRCLRCDHFGYGIFRGGRDIKW